MSKDILVFNKQGGVGIGVTPIEDLLTSEGRHKLPVHDNNGNTVSFNVSLENPPKPSESYNNTIYKIFEEEVEKTPAGYNTINVPARNVLYLFTNVNLDSVLVDIPISNLKNVSISDLTHYTGIYAVKIDNTAGANVKIYYKDCKYAEVLL